MPWRKVGWYWVTFTLLLAAYWLFSRGLYRHQPGERGAFPLPGGFPQAIDLVEVQGKGRRTMVTRDEKGWRTPSGRRVDDLVAALLEAVVVQAGQGPVLQHGDHPENLGLSPATLTVVFHSKGAGASLAVRLGQRNPGGTGVYVQVEGSPGVYLWGLQVAYYAELLLERD